MKTCSSGAMPYCMFFCPEEIQQSKRKCGYFISMKKDVEEPSGDI